MTKRKTDPVDEWPSNAAKLKLQESKNETFVQIRVQRIQNGYLLRAGDKPVHYTTMQALVDSLSRGLLVAENRWSLLGAAADAEATDEARSKT